MNADPLKLAWAAQTTPVRLTIDADLLLQVVQRNARDFTAAILWRDAREIGVCFLLVPVWLYLGMRFSLPWSWFLMVPALLGVGLFMLIDHARHRRPPNRAEPLHACVEGSLAAVEHQIWLLRNVLWWYLLPPTAATLVFVGQIAWQTRLGGWLAILSSLISLSICVTIFAGVYWLNQKAVRAELEPRRQELRQLLNSLSADGAAAVDDLADPTAPPDFPTPPGARLGALLLLALAIVGTAQAEPAQNATPASATRNDPAITNLLGPILARHQVPAMAAALVTSQGLTRVGVIGLRKRGTDIAVTLEDRWQFQASDEAIGALMGSVLSIDH